jgi:hypothetical protein
MAVTFSFHGNVLWSASAQQLVHHHRKLHHLQNPQESARSDMNDSGLLITALVTGLCAGGLITLIKNALSGSA